MRTDPEGDRHPARRGDLFIVGSIGSGATLASSSGNDVLPVVLGASTLVLLACLGIPPRGGGGPADGRRGPPVLGSHPFRVCASGESPSLLRLRDAILALPSAIRRDYRLALGGSDSTLSSGSRSREPAAISCVS